ncbi:uncharacterized protein LOC111432431 isoform X1 [Cucurbita moschata]|uniref:Uncharacterized protein LOC111432431 isoform X1 n=1 Tax=Cucurbita moschata TaxID=3662 RepID=A0A6J1EGV9_CUCMO|nr:uncharacterized protein LOC111432431 isoform X1 [Cucurbita moschata]
MEIGFRVRKFVVVSIRIYCRSVRNYPFLFGLLCLLILLYRSCPFLFSILVSASPVLICTAVLLGTLLSFGKPNIPEIETEEVASLKSGILDNATVLTKEDDSFTVERLDGVKVGNSYVESSEEDRKTSTLDEHADFLDFVPVIHERDFEIQFKRGGVEEFKKNKVEEFEKNKVEEFGKNKVEEFGKNEVEELKKGEERELPVGSELEERREIFERDFDIKGLATDGEKAVEDRLLAAESLRNEIIEVEDRNISREPFHKGDNLNLSLNDKDVSDENDYGSSGSESDRAESSSPDASMADIMPLLDELHPLLDLETLLPAPRSNEESDASSEQSRKSDGECVISDDEAENQGEEGSAIEHDDNDDDDDEGMDEEKEDESKSAIKWTEDDQKNLMDLGNLELERNQRLENLIARRKARNNVRMLAVKNLIDFDGFDIPVNVPPISTAKLNPFDLPYDSYNNMGLPPIPGSAPSILLPRRNPFDLPYDPNEEKPDLKSDDFEHKDILRRHESFSVGDSSFAVPKLEQQNIRWKPYFIPEKTAAEGTSYAQLERQFSEVSESKLSSVSDTESMSSIADQDDKKPDESQSFLETTAVSYLDPMASELGNGSWEDIGSEDYIQEDRDVHHEVIEITLGSTESRFESQSGSSETGAADTPVEINATEIHSKSLLIETDYSSNSSMSSLLEEVNETSSQAKKDEARLSSSRVKESSVETTSTSLPTALEEDANFKIACDVLDDNHNKESLYDSSPSAEGKDSEVHSEIEQDATSSLKDMHDASAELHAVDKNEQESREDSEVTVHLPTNTTSHVDLDHLVGMADPIATSRDHLTTNATILVSQEQNKPTAMEEQVLLISSSSTFPSELEQVEECSMNEKDVRFEQDFVRALSVESHKESALQDLDIKIASSGSSSPNVTREVMSSATQFEQSWSDKPMVEPVIGHRDGFEERGSLSTDSAAEVNSENVAPKVHQDISTALSLVVSDSSSSSSDHDFRPPYAARDKKDGIVDQVVFEDHGEVTKHLDYPTEVYDSHFSEKTIREEVDEIAYIDEGLLLELDEVGDFSVKEVGEPVRNEKVIPEEAQAKRPTEAKLDIPILEARTLDDINLAFRQVHEGVDVEDVVLPSATESQLKKGAISETNSNLEVVEARSLGDIHVPLAQVSENNIVESSSSSEPAETEPNSSSNPTETKNEAKPETSSDFEAVEAKSPGDNHVALMQVSGKTMSELPTSSVSNDPSKESEQAGADSITAIASPSTTDAENPKSMPVTQ